MIVFHEPAKEIKLNTQMISDLTKYTKKWFRLFEFQERGWELHVYFETVPVDEDGKPEEIDFESASADTKVQSEYQVGTIRYYILALIEKNREKELETYALHEMLHILISPYTQAATTLASDLDNREVGGYDPTLGLWEENLVTQLERLKFFYRLK